MARHIPSIYLVQQADELAKLEQSCKSVVDKVADSLRSLLEGDEEKIQEQKVVNDSMYKAYAMLRYGKRLSQANVYDQSQYPPTSNPSPGTK
jgi:hypothetical protein